MSKNLKDGQTSPRQWEQQGQSPDTEDPWGVCAAARRPVRVEYRGQGESGGGWGRQGPM